MNQRVFGILLVVAGVLALLHTLGLADAGSVFSTWWPLAVILVGLSQLRGGSQSGGAIVIIIGAAFLLRNLGILPPDFMRVLWPLVLVAGGLFLLFGRRSSGPASHDAPSVRLVSAFSGSQHRLDSGQWSGAELTVLFGSLDVDARTAQPAPEGTVVDVGVLAGGIVLRVPETWQVVPEALVLLGGIDDKRPRPAGNTEDAPRVHIRGFVLMGGIEVQS